MPVKIQLAFQGGGARIAALLAAAEVIQQYQNSGRIQITRVAGTSAGSIVACLLGAGISIDTIRQLLRNGKGQELINQYDSPSIGKFCWKMLRSKPIWDVTPLRDWLTNIFQEYGFAKLEEIKSQRNIDVFVVSSDLANRTHSVSSGGECIANAIVDSCALPFLFRVWNGSTRVDGGICENLPTSSLSDDEVAHGHIVAVSFQSIAPKQVDGFANFSLALLDSSISSSMAQTRSRLHPNSILELKTRLSTFSFREALSSGLVDEYDKIKMETQLWLDEYLRQKKNGIAAAKADPWKDPNPTAQFLLNNMTELYRTLFNNAPLEYIRCRFSVTINSLRKQNAGDPFEHNPDQAAYELTFMAGNEVVHAMAMSIIEQPGETKFAGATAECRFTDGGGNVLKVLAIPVRDPQEPTSRQLAIFFNPPLAPKSGPYTLSFREDAHNLMPDLLNKGIEPICFLPQRAAGTIGRVELVIHVPKKSKVIMSPQGSGGRAMTKEELGSYTPPHGDLQTQGCCADSLDKNSSFFVDVSSVPAQ